MANRDEGLQLLDRSRGSLLSIVGAERTNGYRTAYPPQPENDQPLDFSTKRPRLKLPEPNLRFTPSPEVHTPTDYHSPSLYLSGNGPHITEVDEAPATLPKSNQDKTTLLCDALSRVPSLGFGIDSVSPELATGLLSNMTPTNGLMDPRKPYKYTRPFKAYPRDPLNVPLGYYGLPMQLPLATDAMATQTILSSASDQAYLQFREQMMANKRIGPDHHHQQQQQRRNERNGFVTERNIPQQNKSFSGSDGESNGSSAALPSSTENGNHHRDSCDSDEKMCNTVGTSSNVNEDDQMMQLSRKRGRSLPEELKDEAYWERRRKNNEAAKRSRDARRAKEDEIAIRAAFLEQENLKLRVELAALKNETAKLRCLLPVYNS